MMRHSMEKSQKTPCYPDPDVLQEHIANQIRILSD
jgi:hypothetical protein